MLMRNILKGKTGEGESTVTCCGGVLECGVTSSAQIKGVAKTAS